MTDIFAHWKRNRFVIVGTRIFNDTTGNMIILSDIEYWSENYNKLQSWCEEYGAEVCGMTVTCDEATLTAFCLKWS
jgi:hypothetical protein